MSDNILISTIDQLIETQLLLKKNQVTEAEKNIAKEFWWMGRNAHRMETEPTTKVYHLRKFAKSFFPDTDSEDFDFTDDNFECVAIVASHNKEKVYESTQNLDESWTTNKENVLWSVRPQVRSTSVGDILLTSGTETTAAAAWRCEPIGWMRVTNINVKL